MTRINPIRVGWAAVCITLAVLRLAGAMDNRYQAFAHLVTGGLLGAWALGMMVQKEHRVPVRPAFYGWMALALTLVEVFAFALGLGRVDGQ